MLQVLDNFMGYSNQKAEKKILSRSGVISILVKSLKRRKNQNISRNIEFHGLLSCQIERESKVTHKKKKKKISDSPSLRYIFQVGVSAGHVIPWTGDQIFFYSPECLKQVPGTKLKSKNHIWNGILGVDNYDVVHSIMQLSQNVSFRLEMNFYDKNTCYGKGISEHN